MKVVRVIDPPKRRLRRLLRRRSAHAVPGRKILRPADLSRLRGLLFAARTVVEGMYAGKHKSPFKGLSPEFVEYKGYTPGDPVESIDWKAFARSDRHYIKLTEKQTDMNCYLLLDGSGSMAYRGADQAGGERLSKFDYAALLAAALAYLIVRQGDKVGLTLFDRNVTGHVPAGGTFRHLSAVLDPIERHRPARQTRLAGSLCRAFGLMPRRGLLIVVSDFYEDPAALFRALGLYTHRRFEIILFHVLHRDEYRLPSLAHARFSDLESGEQLTCTPDDVRAAYDRELQAFVSALRAGARARRIDYNLVTTETPYHDALKRYLLRRRAVKR